MRIYKTASVINKLESTNCKTIYEVDGVKVELWIIVGGEPALAFNDDYSYTERFPKVDAWDSDKHWVKEKQCFDFQIPDAPGQGPTYDILPEGRLTLEKFVAKNLPRKNLTKARYDALPIKETIRSDRVKDKAEGSSCVALLGIHPYRLDPVMVTWGRRGEKRDDKIVFFPEWWKKVYEFSHTVWHKYPNLEWSDLTNEEYKTIVNLLNIFLDYYR